jgi:ankyrin repeat protein
MNHLPLTATLQDYQAQADLLLRGHAEGDPDALRVIHQKHPRFLSTDPRWLPLPLSNDDIRKAPFSVPDSRLALARWYEFLDWDALTKLVTDVQMKASGVSEFESAAETMISGDLAALKTLLQHNPDLVSERSTRITSRDPAVHRATLLHYIAANGVEGYRQRTPVNAVEIARTLLDAGADPNALADMYGGEFTTLSMLVSSSPPAEAGLQVALAEALLDYGAEVDEHGAGKWTSPLMTALVFGFRDTAEALVRRGASLVTLAAAAGLGRMTQAEALLPTADSDERLRALSLAAQLGHVEVVRLLLDAGESPDRFNPDGMHAHSTPLHQAALAGHEAVVRLLVERGARLDIKDKIWQRTPGGWAEHGGHYALADYLRKPG